MIGCVVAARTRTSLVGVRNVCFISRPFFFFFKQVMGFRGSCLFSAWAAILAAKASLTEVFLFGFVF